MEIFRDIGFSVIYDSQRIFRIVLDCMARPGKINQLPHSGLRAPQGANPYILAVLRTVLDQQVSFFVIAKSPKLCEAIRSYLTLNTGSCTCELEKADFIYSVEPNTNGQISHLKRGSVMAPEGSATMIYDVERITAQEDGTVRNLQDSAATYLLLNGPGIYGERRVGVYAPGFPDEIADLIKTRAPFPLGVDAVLV
ncbi:MAG: phosphonate C-P lyase system protein PhnH, partial [Deltaproteobacteria bacterium]|nr:phosphonate C-P lyase system protein PhnH [Deltaproteobacteria bacterium]